MLTTAQGRGRRPARCRGRPPPALRSRRRSPGSHRGRRPSRSAGPGLQSELPPHRPQPSQPRQGESSRGCVRERDRRCPGSGDPRLTRQPHRRGRSRARDGAQGRAAVPSGASTGAHEAVELRDGGERYGGKGVRTAVTNVNGEIADAVGGLEALDQRLLDDELCRLDGTPNKGRLGCERHPRCVARGRQGRGRRVRPAACTATSAGPTRTCCRCRCMNVLNGGAHADSNVDIQEFMLAPVGAASFREALRWGAETYHALKQAAPRPRAVDRARRRGRVRAQPAVERGGADRCSPARSSAAGYEPGAEIALALDCRRQRVLHRRPLRAHRRGQVVPPGRVGRRARRAL